MTNTFNPLESVVSSALDPVLQVTPAQSPTISSANRQPHYLIFELGYTGHYPHYIRHLAKYWIESNLPGKLTVVVSPQFAAHHAEVLGVGVELQPGRLKFEVLPHKDADKLVPRQSPWKRAKRSLQEWALLQEYATRLEITHCLLLYFDSFQTAALLKRPMPCAVSGIYFRPTLHYATFAQYHPTRKMILQAWREKLVLPQVLKHPQLRHLFCLDPFFVDFARSQLNMAAPLYLPDPVEASPHFSQQQVTDFKQQLAIEPNRITFLLFGALYDRRKGIEQVLEAIAQLSSQTCQKICLLLVGQLDVVSPLRTRIENIARQQPIQIIIRDGFVPDEEVALSFQSADVVLAPYQQHVGMSGILVHAAAAQKPLIASNYGLLGELVQRLELGLSVDSTEPKEIGAAMERCLDVPLETIGDHAKMLDFAQQNSTENFARKIFKTISAVPISMPSEHNLEAIPHMTTTVDFTAEQSSDRQKNPKVAWLLQGAGAYWQPILSEFTHVLKNTKVFTAEWTGFLPGFEETFSVEQVGPMKIVKLPGKSNGYDKCVTYLPPGVMKPIVKYRPEVIFTTGFSLWTMLVCFLKPLFRWRVVIVYDGSSPGVDYRNSWVRSLQRRWLASLTDAFITNNKAGKQYIVEALQVPAERVFARPYLLPHPKTYAASLEVAKPLMETKQRPVFVFAGNVIPRKGLRELLTGCALLKADGHEDFTLVIVGDGSEREELADFVQQEGLDEQIVWVGEVAYEQVGAYFNAADVFVFPTREDVWGLVLVEAMMFGKPVLVSKWAGAAEMVKEGENGYVFDPYEPKRLAELMAKFIEEPELLERMGTASREIMVEHQLEKVARSLTQVVDFVLEKQ